MQGGDPMLLAERRALSQSAIPTGDMCHLSMSCKVVPWLASILLISLIPCASALVTSLSREDETLEFARSNEIAVFGLFDKADLSSRELFRSVASSPEFDGAISFAEGADPANFDWMRGANSLQPPVVILARGIDSVSVFERPKLYSTLKSFIFREALPPIVHLNPTTTTGPQRALASFAFQQEVVSKFIVLTSGPLDEEVEEELTDFAIHHKGDFVAFSVDFTTEEAIGVALLEVAGLERGVVFDGMPRPVALMLGPKSSMVFEGLFERSPFELFWADWGKAGKGGCKEKWKDPSGRKKASQTKLTKRKKKSKSKGISRDL
jgi:hypothetical protein